MNSGTELSRFETDLVRLRTQMQNVGQQIAKQQQAIAQQQQNLATTRGAAAYVEARITEIKDAKPKVSFVPTEEQEAMHREAPTKMNDKAPAPTPAIKRPVGRPRKQAAER
jgi:peptidoglycan hydrolase CwlO-like protein